MKNYLSALLLMSVLAAAEEPACGSAFFHTAWPEASAVAAVGTPSRWLVVADNEIPKLAVYPLDRPSSLPAPALATATSPAFAVDDTEAVTVYPWDENGDGKAEAVLHVFVGSCSRSKSGKVQPARDALFAVKIDTAALEAGKPAFPDTVEYNRTLRSQLRALGSENPGEKWGLILRDSVAPSGAKPDAQIPSLANETGLNVEGLSLSSDGKSLLLGLRSPLVEGKALLIPITNPVAALGLGESAPQPAIPGTPLLLDLGGLGFRSIEWDDAAGRYLIAAGNAGGTKSFRLFSWSGKEGESPAPLTSPEARAAEKIDPEGITPVPGRKAAAVVGDGSAGTPYHEGRWLDFGAAK